MFERFTDRARRVVVLSQEEARRLRHNYIGTEHILLGLVREDEGVAAQALAGLGLTLDLVRGDVEQTLGAGEQPSDANLPFTPRAKKVLELSLREALQLGHNHIGTEHILLGLVREGEGVASQVLVKHGAHMDLVRERVTAILSAYPPLVPPAPRRDRRQDLRRILTAIEDVGRAKAAAISAEDFERAATLRDQERTLLAEKADAEKADAETDDDAAG